MKRFKVLPEIFIWIYFSVMTGFGYAFSFFEYIDRNTGFTKYSILIPTVIWLLMAVLCTIAFGMLQRIRYLTNFKKSELIFLEVSVAALLLAGGWIFRFVEQFHNVWPAGLETEFFEAAFVSQNASAYLNPHLASRIYVAFLHVICLLLGNIYSVGAEIQFLLLLIASGIWYFALRKSFGSIVALFFLAGAMLLPDSIQVSMQCNPVMLTFIFYGIAALCIVWYAKCKTIYSKALDIFLCFLLGMLTGFVLSLDISGLLAAAVLFGVILHKHRRLKAAALRIINVLAGFLISFGILIGVQRLIYDMDLDSALLLNSYSRLSFDLPAPDTVKAFLFSLGNHPIFIASIVVIAVYWLLNKKRIFNWIMFMELALLTVQLLGLDMYMAHDFMIYVGIMVLLGISAKQYLVYQEEKAAQIDYTVQTFDFEAEDAVTVPAHGEEEKPLIFIPKSMEIPRRVSKPKIDFAMEVAEKDLHFDVPVSEDADYDL